MTDYFDTLTERLRAHGMDSGEIAGTVEDLVAYAADSGADPREEFGTPEEFAALLAASSGRAAPAPDTETWRWTADAFHEVERLNEFGDQGWEVERVDGRAHFVSRRDRDAPQRWEYRRETVVPVRESRAAVADRLAPDGWEHCGTWICFEYFKRPKAADVGPAAALDEAPSAPGRKGYWSSGMIALLGAFVAIAAYSIATNPVMIIAGLVAGGVTFAVGSVMARRSSRR